VAIVSARGYAGSWNDGSRLATVECLVDYHTLAIEQSIFVAVPADHAPYDGSDPVILRYGTLDKLYIDGHFYSDKSPVPALLLAGVYQVLQWCTAWTARDHPWAFCYCLTLASSGLAYVMAVVSIFLLGRPLRLPEELRWLVTASFALATVAPAYARQVNSHILFLGVAAVLFLRLAWLAEQAHTGRIRSRGLLTLGSLAGLGYTLDLGTGPVLLVCVAAWTAFRCRSLGAVGLLVLSAAPWLAAHHLVNYAVGATWAPANTVPEYLDWPGSIFGPSNMTGTWKHDLGSFTAYASSLFFGKRGFVLHNLPLWLFPAAVIALLRRRPAELPEVVCACAWFGGTWLLYAVASNNSSGLCCSVRWFLPLLVPAYLVLGLYLREVPARSRDMLILSGWGALLACCMWYQGPWMRRTLPYVWFWALQAGAIVAWQLRAQWPSNTTWRSRLIRRKRAYSKGRSDPILPDATDDPSTQVGPPGPATRRAPRRVDAAIPPGPAA
jgi:hypothetical protein